MVPYLLGRPTTKKSGGRKIPTTLIFLFSLPSSLLFTLAKAKGGGKESERGEAVVVFGSVGKVEERMDKVRCSHERIRHFSLLSLAQCESMTFV